MERKIRKFKRASNVADAMGLDSKKQFYSGKIKEWETKRAQFCKETGLRKDTWRERVGETKGNGSGEIPIDKDNSGGKIAGSGVALDGLPYSSNNAANVTFDNAVTSTKDADGGRCNNTKMTFGYDMNCQSCVPTFLARLRGENVTALPRYNGKEIEDVSLHPNHAYIDKKTGKYPKYEPL